MMVIKMLGVVYLREAGGFAVMMEGLIGLICNALIKPCRYLDALMDGGRE